MTHIGFCGLGIMGSGMAKRLLRAGFEITVYNRGAARAEELASRRERCRCALRSGGERRFRDRHGRRRSRLPRSLERCAENGTAGIDPDRFEHDYSCSMRQLTGSRPQANNGELLFLVGGGAATLEKARTVLEPMSRGIVHLGGNGAGAAMKLINNFLCGVQASSLAEAIAWIERSGLNRAAALSILTAGAPASPLVKRLSERMCDPPREINFRLDLMMKDLEYSTREGRNHGIELPTGLAALARFEDAAAKGFGDRDLSAVIEPLRESR
jgi:3-hydroxyisobutyrate dehydrogenase